MVTMVDVAKLAGVSTMTVSNVLNDRPSVNPAMRERVLSAVATSGYVLNHAARSLRTGSTGVIGLALPEINSPYSGALAARVVERAAALGYRVTIEHTGAKVEGELAAIALSRTLECDGLILTAVGIGPEQIQRLGQTIPLVLLGERSFAGVADHVGMDNHAGTFAAATHLLQQGSRHLVWLGTADTADEADDPLRQRLEGYRDALSAAGIVPDPRLRVALPNLTMACAAAAVHDLGDRGLHFDGLVAVTDTIAFGAMRGLADRGLRIPTDVRVVGFDDVIEGQFSIPTLSTVSPDHDWMVDTALRMLIDQISGVESPRTELTAPFQLVIRESTA